MALNWSIEECNNWQTLKSNEQWPFTNQLIWATLAIDMNEITETNAAEFYARVKVIELCSGGLIYTDNGTIPIIYQHITDRIGLHTNAYSRNTFKQWFKRIAMAYSSDHSENELLAAYYSAKAEVEKLTERVSA